MNKNNYDDSTVGEGVIAWLCFNLGIIPLFVYAFYLHANKGRTFGIWGILGKKASITFGVLFLIELIIVICIFSGVK